MNDRRELERKLEQTKRLSMLAGDFTTRQRLLELQYELVDAGQVPASPRMHCRRAGSGACARPVGAAWLSSRPGSGVLAPRRTRVGRKLEQPFIGDQAEEGTDVRAVATRIECRAYRLWEQAGQPQGRDKEFYVEAERQLKEEQFGPQLGSRANR